MTHAFWATLERLLETMLGLESGWIALSVPPDLSSEASRG
jgi:hypothetical protein